MRSPFRSRVDTEPAADPVGTDDGNTLSQIRRLTEDDERPTREDRGYGETIFSRPPVPLPRVLTGRRGSARGKSTAGRLQRWRERRAERRARRAQRHLRGGDFQDAARQAEGDAWGKARFR